MIMEAVMTPPVRNAHSTCSEPSAPCLCHESWSHSACTVQVLHTWTWIRSPWTCQQLMNAVTSNESQPTAESIPKLTASQ